MAALWEAMANPEHVPTLDGHDRLTVALYRAGLVVAWAGVGAVATGSLTGWEVLGPVGVAGVLAGVLLAAVHLHLYDKRVRWVVQGAAGLGAWAVGTGSLLGLALLGHAGLGFLYVAVSGFALKERFCFRVPGLGAVPWLLAGSLAPRVFDLPVLEGALLGLACVPLGVLLVAKARQPLHFDIGDRSRYQV